MGFGALVAAAVAGLPVGAGREAVVGVFGAEVAAVFTADVFFGAAAVAADFGTGVDVAAFVAAAEPVVVAVFFAVFVALAVVLEVVAAVVFGAAELGLVEFVLDAAAVVVAAFLLAAEAVLTLFFVVVVVFFVAVVALGTVAAVVAVFVARVA